LRAAVACEERGREREIYRRPACCRACLCRSPALRVGLWRAGDEGRAGGHPCGQCAQRTRRGKGLTHRRARVASWSHRGHGMVVVQSRDDLGTRNARGGVHSVVPRYGSVVPRRARCGYCIDSHPSTRPPVSFMVEPSFPPPWHDPWRDYLAQVTLASEAFLLLLYVDHGHVQFRLYQVCFC